MTWFRAQKADRTCCGAQSCAGQIKLGGQAAGHPLRECEPGDNAQIEPQFRGYRRRSDNSRRLAAGGNASATRLLLAKMASLSINAAVMADPGNQNTDDDIVAAAAAMAMAILGTLDGA